MNTPYEVLGVQPGASSDDIRAAYRALARDLHPDAADAPPDAHIRMAEVNEAWSILGDPGRRYAYDSATAEPASPVHGLGPADVVAPASPVEAIVPLASAIGLILAGLGFAGGAPGVTFVGVFLIGVAIVAFLIRRKRL